jgi:hypothetical protein
LVPEAPDFALEGVNLAFQFGDEPLVHLFGEGRAHGFALYRFPGVWLGGGLLDELFPRGEQDLELLHHFERWRPELEFIHLATGVFGKVLAIPGIHLAPAQVEGALDLAGGLDGEAIAGRDEKGGEGFAIHARGRPAHARLGAERGVVL